MGTYKSDFFQRIIVQNNAPLAAGSYKRGQLLGRTDATGVYGAFDPDDDTGLEKVRAVCVNDAVLAAAGIMAIARGEFEKEGLVALNAGLAVPVTITDAVIGQCFDAGIILD
jgi:hypothetical protein